MNHVIESIGRWGVVSSPIQVRLGKVCPGDIIEVPENLRTYPTTHQFSRISSISRGVASVCEDMGSAYLNQDGSCDISGGPFWSMPVSLLEPQYRLRDAVYWNWGNNSPGAGQGVYYTIARPVHTLTVSPNELQYRYQCDEESARRKEVPYREFLSPDEWDLIWTGTDDGQDSVFVFRWK